MEIKKIRKIKTEEGPTRNQKMRYSKIPLYRNFVQKVRDYSGQMTRVSDVLGKKLGYNNVTSN